MSESCWRTRLHADPAAVGRSVKLGGETFEIVGVVRVTFHGVHAFIPGSVWIPETAVPDRAGTGWPARQLTDRRLGSVSVWGRLKPGVSLAQASAKATVIAHRLDVVFADFSLCVGQRRPSRQASLDAARRNRRRRRARPARRGRFDHPPCRRDGAAHCLHQPREPVARERHIASARNRRPHCARRLSLAIDP